MVFLYLSGQSRDVCVLHSFGQGFHLVREVSWSNRGPSHEVDYSATKISEGQENLKSSQSPYRVLCLPPDLLSNCRGLYILPTGHRNRCESKVDKFLNSQKIRSKDLPALKLIPRRTISLIQLEDYEITSLATRTRGQFKYHMTPTQS